MRDHGSGARGLEFRAQSLLGSCSDHLRVDILRVARFRVRGLYNALQA